MVVNVCVVRGGKESRKESATEGRGGGTFGRHSGSLFLGHVDRCLHSKASQHAIACYNSQEQLIALKETPNTAS